MPAGALTHTFTAPAEAWTLDVEAFALVVIEFSGDVIAGNVTPAVSVTGTTFVPRPVVSAGAGSGVRITSGSAAPLGDIWSIPVAGMASLRLTTSGGWDGTMTATARGVGDMAAIDLAANVRAATAVAAIFGLSDSETNIPTTFASGDGTTRVDLINYMLAYRGNLSIFSNPWARLRTPEVFKVVNAVAITSEATLWTPLGGFGFRLMGFRLASTVSGDVLLKDGMAGTVIDVIPMGANKAEYGSYGNGIVSTVADNPLRAIGPSGAVLSGSVWGQHDTVAGGG
jgi:hypothetical protein